jgi:hypothetical protein
MAIVRKCHGKNHCGNKCICNNTGIAGPLLSNAVFFMMSVLRLYNEDSRPVTRVSCEW